MGGAVVSFERSSVLWLRMPKFNTRDAYGAAVFGSKVQYAGFGFGCGGDNIFDSLENYVDGAVDFVFIFPSKTLDGGCADLCLGEDKEISV